MLQEKFLLLSLLLILVSSMQYLGQYSSFKHQGHNNSESKKEVKKTTDIQSKTKDCDVSTMVYLRYTKVRKMVNHILK